MDSFLCQNGQYCTKAPRFLESGMFERIEVVDKALEAMRTAQHDPEDNYKSIIQEMEAADRT